MSLPPSPGSSSCCSLAEPGCLAGMGLTTAPPFPRCDKNIALPQLVRLIVKIVDGVKNGRTNTVFPVLSKVLRQGFVSANVWSCEISLFADHMDICLKVNCVRQSTRLSADWTRCRLVCFETCRNTLPRVTGGVSRDKHPFPRRIWNTGFAEI